MALAVGIVGAASAAGGAGAVVGAAELVHAARDRCGRGAPLGRRVVDEEESPGLRVAGARSAHGGVEDAGLDLPAGSARR